MGSIYDRLFEVIESHNYGTLKHEVKVVELFVNQDDLEVINAMAEVGNEVLDLEVGESMYFQPNRDDKTSKGIIRRAR